MKEIHESIGTILDIGREPNLLKAVSASLQWIDKAKAVESGSRAARAHA